MADEGPWLEWPWRSDDDHAQHTLRLSGFARLLVEEMKKPGVLRDDGCTLGDVLEVAFREFNPQNS